MSNTREIRTRINSVQSTMKITNAMYLLSSSKLKKARNHLDRVAPFFNKIQDTMAEILNHTEGLESIYFEPSGGTAAVQNRAGQKKHLYLVISSDKGLAGAYNHNVIKLVEATIKPEEKNTLMFIGYNARNYFERVKSAGTADIDIDEEYCYAAVDPVEWRALYMALHILELYRSHEADEVTLVYTKMLNALSSDAEVLPLLPLKRGMFTGLKKKKSKKSEEPTEEDKSYLTSFLPTPRDVLESLVPDYIQGVIFGAMVEAYAAEQNARMQAMDNATSNAKDMVHDLSLLYNRVRQASITQEITEVVGGAEAQK